MAGPSATYSATLNSPNTLQQPSHRRAGSVSKSDAFFSSNSTLLPLPPQAIARRASDSCLPPPCASTFALSSLTPTATSTLIPRISAPSATETTTNDRQETVTKKRRSSLTESREEYAKSSGPSISLVGSIEKRLEEAVQHLSEKQAQQAEKDSEEQDNDDDEDMYNDVPSSSDRYSAPFLPQFPLEPLEMLFTPRHRSIDVFSVRRALSRSIKNVPTPGRRVNFANSVAVVDVFAAADYPGRRGPPPVEKLSMRDILELREVKIELGTYQPLSDSIQSTSFSKVSNIESGNVTSPTSPTASHFSDISIEDEEDVEARYDAGEGTCDNYSPSPPMSGPSSQESTSLPSSVEISLSSSASSFDPSPSTAPTTASSSYSVSYTHRQYVNPTIKSLREQSPDSMSTMGSALSSPALSISGSPSASESDFAVFDEDDEDVQPIKLVITPETPSEEKSSLDMHEGGNKTPTQASRFDIRASSTVSGLSSYTIQPSAALQADQGYFKIPIKNAGTLATPTSFLQSRRVSEPALPFSSRKGSASSGKMNLFDTPIAPLSGPWGLGR